MNEYSLAKVQSILSFSDLNLCIYKAMPAIEYQQRGMSMKSRAFFPLTPFEPARPQRVNRIFILLIYFRLCKFQYFQAMFYIAIILDSIFYYIKEMLDFCNLVGVALSIHVDSFTFL